MSTIKINQLATGSVESNDFIITADGAGVATKNTVQDLADAINTNADAEPTEGSTNTVQSGGVYDALALIPVAKSSFTFFIASNDASQETKDVADFVCDGSNDEIVINNAISQLPDVYDTGKRGGSILFSEGNFYFEDPVQVTELMQITLQGMGNSTMFWMTNEAVPSSTLKPIISIEHASFSSEIWDKTMIKDIFFISQSQVNAVGVKCNLLHYVFVEGCIFKGNKMTGVHFTDVNNGSITNNLFTDVLTGVKGVSDVKDIEDVIISNNHFTAARGEAIYLTATEITGAKGISRNILSNNIIEECNKLDSGVATIYIEKGQNLNISNNIISESGGSIDIHLKDCEEYVSVFDNNITEAVTGVFSENCSGLEIRFNHIDASVNGLDIDSNSNALMIGNNSSVQNNGTGDLIEFNNNGINVSGGDIEVKDIGDGVVVKSPNGTRFRISVDNSGALSATTV